ncbi:MAG TPA: AarF/ABC1/UbiB kinase family protein [Syntrophales bacterium]|nr:AarF/ABC1/UbiB kinase family protein [Syntrophales bacterium]HQB29419.1 AarF/ABC1/UbiB kinase family protein [Syntrophales bacterium]
MTFGKANILRRTYRHVRRYRQILSVIIRYGFGDILDRVPLRKSLEARVRAVSGKPIEGLERLTRAERIRLAMEELGPTFIKLGQILSTRPDLVPVDLVEELAGLQDNVPPFPFSQVRSIVEKELGRPLGEVYLRFDEAPLAAASIGQVHRAALRGGEEVIVKVQRPGIEETVTADLEILHHLAVLLERHTEEGAFYRPARIVEEFARTMGREMDYRTEADQGERFARLFRGNETLHVPRMYRGESSKRVLTMEYVQGIKASRVDLLDAGGYDRKIIARRGADLLLEQIFHFGFFHGDPHPGNLAVLPGNVICYLDFGMMGSVDRRSREDMADMVYAIVKRDEAKAAAVLLQLVEWEEEPDRRALERDLSELMDLYVDRPLKEIRMEAVLEQLLRLISRHRLRLPWERYLMVKALATTEGLGRVLDPDFDMTARAAPFVRRLKADRLRPGRIAGEIGESMGDLVLLLREIPADIREILKQLRQGRTRIGFEHRGLEDFLFEMDRSSNRISFALVASAIIIGSSLIIQADVGPRIFGVSALGLFGFLLAAVLGVWLLIAVLRSGKL